MPDPLTSCAFAADMLLSDLLPRIPQDTIKREHRMHVKPRSSKVCNCCQLLFFDGYAHQATAIKAQYIPVKTKYDPKEQVPKVIRRGKVYNLLMRLAKIGLKSFP